MSFYTAQDGQTHVVGKKLTTTSTFALYTSNERLGAVLKSISVCNITGTATTFSLWLNDGTTDFYIFKDAALAGNTTVTMDNHNAILRNGWALNSSTGTANSVDIVAVLAQTAPGAANVS